MNIRNIVIRLAFVAALALSGAAVVGAQEPPNPGGRGDHMRERFPNFQVDREALMAVVEDYTGLTPSETREALRDGATLGELIESNGGTVEAFVTDATAPAFAEIDAAVEAGRLDADRAETLKASVTERLMERVQNVGPVRGRPNRPVRNMMNNLDGELVEAYTGLDEAALREALRDGATLAELIEANDASVDEFLAEAVTTAEAAIQARADERLANLEIAIIALVYGERPNIADGE